jgi:DNA-binding beta-propeller fold protein YncE
MLVHAPRSAPKTSIAQRLTAYAVVVVLAACGSPKAAEPATAPAVAVSPAGQIIKVGEQAEGIVADPETHLVAVGVRDPDGLALLDGSTGRLAGRVALPGHLRHLELAGPGGPVLVPDEDSGNLISVRLPGGAILSTLPVGKYPHAVTRTDDGTLAVADELGGAFVLVRDGRVIKRFTDVTQPGGVAAVGALVGVIDVRERTLSLYDTWERKRIDRIEAGHGPTHMVADSHGHFQVVDTSGNRLLTYQLRPRLRRIGATALPGTPYGVAYDSARDRLWVTLTARNQVVAVDLGGREPVVTATIPTVRQPNTVAVDSATGRVFVASRTDGTVQMIDPAAH